MEEGLNDSLPHAAKRRRQQRTAPTLKGELRAVGKLGREDDAFALLGDHAFTPTPSRAMALTKRRPDW